MSSQLDLWANMNPLPPFFFPPLGTRFMSSLFFFHFPCPLDVFRVATLKWDALTEREYSCGRMFVAGR